MEICPQVGEGWIAAECVYRPTWRSVARQTCCSSVILNSVEPHCLGTTSTQALDGVVPTSPQHPSGRVVGYCKLADVRGEFLGIVNHGNWQEINIVHSKAASTRGGHYHRKTTEIIFMLEGEAEVVLAPCHDFQRPERLTLTAGEGIQITPLTAHLLTYPTDSKHIQLLDLRFDPANMDLFAIDDAFPPP